MINEERSLKRTEIFSPQKLQLERIPLKRTGHDSKGTVPRSGEAEERKKQDVFLPSFKRNEGEVGRRRRRRRTGSRDRARTRAICRKKDSPSPRFLFVPSPSPLPISMNVCRDIRRWITSRPLHRGCSVSSRQLLAAVGERKGKKGAARPGRSR